MGGGARGQPPACHVGADGRPGNQAARRQCPSVSACPSVPHRCVQDPDLIVAVSRIMSLQMAPPEVSEDCLYLNVYAPAGAARGDKLPVRRGRHGNRGP